MKILKRSFRAGSKKPMLSRVSLCNENSMLMTFCHFFCAKLPARVSPAHARQISSAVSHPTPHPIQTPLTLRKSREGSLSVSLPAFKAGGQTITFQKVSEFAEGLRPAPGPWTLVCFRIQARELARNQGYLTISCPVDPQQ
jgi:hypothetical protein